MMAAVVSEWGDAPVYTEVAEPQPAGTAVVASVEASALTNLSRSLVSGKHYASKEITLPAIPGQDGVVRLADGRRLYTGAIASNGLMAEKALVDPTTAAEVPEAVDSVTAAALPNPGMSAWMALDYAAGVTPGARVLVLGATGVTGSTAVQLAKSAFGAGSVVAAGRDTERLDWLRTVGADEFIAMRDEDVAARVGPLHTEQPFDAVLDYLWGTPAEQALAAIADSHPSSHFHRTRWVQIGSMAGPDITLPAGVLRGTAITLSGMGIGSIPLDVLARTRDEALPRMFDMVAAGALTLVTEARPLVDVTAVWASREPSGTRTVLVP